MHDRKDWMTNTKLNHPEFVALIPGNRPLLQPIYQSAKFTPSEDHPLGDQFIYSRISNPTLRQLEKSLADLQKKEDCIVMSSGIAAITGTFLGLFRSGDHFITFKEIYKPARVFIRDFLPRYGIDATFLNLGNMSDLEAHIRPETKAIYFESPTNPNLGIADIEALTTLAKKHKLLLIMDATFAGPHQHTEFEIDIVIHSLTKYVNGHGDVIAGSVAGKASLLKVIKEAAGYFGATLDPHAANLILRGLKTYLLRFERQSTTALRIARFLEGHPRVKRVFYPGLESHPSYSLAVKQMKDMGGVIAFELSPDALTAEKFCHRVEIFQFTASLGSTESLICPSLLFFGLDLPAEDRSRLGLNERTVRLSIGLEDYDDLVRDLDQALRA